MNEFSSAARNHCQSHAESPCSDPDIQKDFGFNDSLTQYLVNNAWF
jgi:hypothetical protein